MKYCMKSLQKNKIANIYAIAISLLVLSLFLAVFIGSTKLNLQGAVRALIKGDIENTDVRILLYVRVPRALASLFCGMALSVSGAVIQAVLYNKLASPSIIGVNAGAGLAVTLCSAFGVIGGFKLSLFSFLGAFLSVMLISTCAKQWGASRGTVILMGVALNAFLGAVSDFVTTLLPEVSVMRSYFKIGDFSSATYSKTIPAGVIIVISVFFLISLSNELDVITLGDDNSNALGLNTDLMRAVFLLLSALLAGAAVSVCGLISFVGLLVPHAVRRIATSEAKHLIPLCALFGAGFVTLCDTLARTAFTPYELPVGIIMAFLGAPFFIFVLIKGKGGRRNA